MSQNQSAGGAPSSTVGLTKVDLSEYTIRLASPSQDDEHLKACFVPWGRGQSWEYYVEEKGRALEGDFARDGGSSTWVLVKRDDFDGPIYSGLRALKRKTLLKRPGSDIVEDVYSYGIFGVVTPVPHLRKGLANHLMKLLHYVLGPSSTLPPFPTSIWGAPPPPLSPEDRTLLPPGIASLLSSGVGPTFYERATIGPDLPGWIVPFDDCQQVSWNLLPPSSPTPSGDWEWIYPSDLPAIGQTMSGKMRNRLIEDYRDSNIPVWSPDPASPGILAYTNYAGYRSRPNVPVSQRGKEPCGIRFLMNGKRKEEGLVLFTVFSYGLMITCIDNLEVEDLEIMLRALDEEGARGGVKFARVWGLLPDSPLVQAWTKMEVRDVKVGEKELETGDYLAIAWYGNPEERGKMVDMQMWCWA